MKKIVWSYFVIISIFMLSTTCFAYTDDVQSVITDTKFEGMSIVGNGSKIAHSNIKESIIKRSDIDHGNLDKADVNRSKISHSTIKSGKVDRYFLTNVHSLGFDIVSGSPYVIKEGKDAIVIDENKFPKEAAALEFLLERPEFMNTMSKEEILDWIEENKDCLQLLE